MTHQSNRIEVEEGFLSCACWHYKPKYQKRSWNELCKTGKFTGIGVFTIVEESEGAGATKWGKLKSGAGWISLDFAKKI